jgi:NADPH:quinone reductase-like Zn-dependent oxidoreductase
MYGLASKNKHQVLIDYRVVPIDYTSLDFGQVIRQKEPGGIDHIFDGIMSRHYIDQGLSLLRRGGKYVGYSEPPSRSSLYRTLVKMAIVNLLPNGKSLKLYGTSFYSINKRPFMEDWKKLFSLLEEGKIEPVIAAKFPILEAPKANQMLESGQVIGNVVLVTPELL